MFIIVFSFSPVRSEYGAFWKCVQAGFTYVFVQLCKMVLLATFFPAGESTPEQGVDLLAVSGDNAEQNNGEDYR